MRLRGGSLVAVCLLLVLASPAAGAPPVVASGIVHYSIVKDGVPPTCAGDGPFTVAYDDVTRSLVVAGSAVGCVPIWSRISNCGMDEDGTVRCDKDVGGNRILITLEAEGAFDYLWQAPDFHEEMHGTLTRTG